MLLINFRSKLYNLLILFIIINFIGVQVCEGQEVIWKKAINWKLYNIIDKAGFTYRLDTLNNFRSINLSDASMQSFMSNVSEWPKEVNSVWMGLYIATCEMEDKLMRKVIISSYGGFFYDQLTKRYYEIPSELKEKWYNFLNTSIKSIPLYNTQGTINDE